MSTEILQLELEIIALKAEIVNLKKNNSEVLDLLNRLTTVIGDRLDNADKNHTSLYQSMLNLSSDFKNLKNCLPEHKVRKDFNDLFNI